MLVSNVRKGLSTIFEHSDRKVPEEDRRDLESCLQSMSAEALPFHWDTSLYAQPCPRPTTSRVRPSREQCEASSEDDEKLPLENPEIDSEHLPRPTNLFLDGLFLTIYQRPQVNDKAWSWSIARCSVCVCITFTGSL